MRIALYGRISTDKQDTLNQLDSFGSLRPLKVGKSFGSTWMSPAARAVIECISKLDLVLFWSLDRFSREGVFETLKHLQSLTGYGVG